MARVSRNVVGIVLLVMLTHTSAWAQATAQMSGTVRDAKSGPCRSDGSDAHSGRPGNASRDARRVDDRPATGHIERPT